MNNFPDILGAEIISIDCETYDPDLLEKGIGATRDGFIAGVAVAHRFTDGPIVSHYYPVRHEGGGNLDREVVWKYLKEILTTPVPKTGANLQYDLSYLWTEGVQVEGPFWDIQVAAPLLDENQFSYSLETQSQTRLGRGKESEAMYEYIRQHFGAKPGKEGGYIWRCPAHIVSPYAKEDVTLPIEIIDQQLKELEAEEMMPLWQMESELLPILVRMHLNGVRVDAMYAEKLNVEWSAKIIELERNFSGINPGSSKQLAAYLQTLGIKCPTTAKGNPSVTGKWMETMEGQVPLFKDMREHKKYTHFLGTFVNGYIVNSHVNGRVHGQFNQLKGDEFGTVSGRLSASNPNLQNIPNPEKDAFFSKQCRGLFLPEHGQEWLRFDFSQIEYRLLVHFASGLAGGVADIARQQYIEVPDTDFHQMCADLTGVSRKIAKNINFGLVYGMGVPKLAASLGISVPEAKKIFKVYHEKAPFAQAFMQAAMQRASNRGYIRTIGNRKRRFDFWESTKFIRKEDKIDGEIYVLKDKQAAIDKWGPIKRAGTHAAANAVLQGSSADITKRSMVEGYKAGIYDVLGFPLTTVHDELGFSVQTGDPVHEEAAAEMKQIMINAHKLVVPVLVTEGRGKSWGEAE